MKLVQTLLVRDEADVIEAHLVYHLNAGVDFVIATDHRSKDGTTEILESYERDGHVRLFREDGEFIKQGEWQTRMSRLAATEHAADWVIPSDCDEFWWPHAESLKEALDAVPETFGCVRALSRTFVPTRDDSEWFGERLTLRLATRAPINDPASTFRPVVKVAHRGHARVTFPGRGAHQVFGIGPPMPGSSPLEILHVPFRSRAQCAWKYKRTWTGWRENPRGDLARARALTEAGRADTIWDRVALDESARDRGLADGSLATDTRLRDALRVLRGDRAGFGALQTSDALRFGTPDVADDVAYTVDLALFDEAEIVRAQRRVDEVEARLAALAGRPRQKVQRQSPT